MYSVVIDTRGVENPTTTSSSRDAVLSIFDRTDR